jgi:hypothetical protein
MMRTPSRAPAHGAAGPIGAARPWVRSRRPARDSLRKAAESAGASARKLTDTLLERAHDDLTDYPGESHGGGLGGTRGDALTLRSRSSRGLRRLARDRIVFNVYEGLEMHGERG